MSRFLKFLFYTFILGFICLGLLFPALAERNVPKNTTGAARLAQQEPPDKSGTVKAELIQATRPNQELAQKLRRYDLLRVDPHAAAAQLRRTGKLSLRTSRGNLEIDVQPYDMRAPGYVSQWIDREGRAHTLPKQPVHTYKGLVSGMTSGQARLTVKEDTIEGSIITGKERFFMQPARALSEKAAVDEFVFYSGEDAVPAEGSCGVTLAEEVAAEQARTDSKLINTADLISPVNPLRLVNMATEADAEYVASFGSPAAAHAQIMNIMNQVDGVYQVEIGLGFQIVFQNAWTDVGTQPYQTTDPSNLLTQFRNHWNNNFTNVARSVAHMWTGKDLIGSTIGIAFINVICRSPSAAYGISQRFPNNSITLQTIDVTAHELGHNFAARHTNVSTPDIPREVERSCVQTIMEAAVGNGGSFCQYSRSQIVGFANANPSCLVNTALPPPVSTQCSETALNFGTQTLPAILSNTDCRSPSRGNRFFADRYSFNAVAGQQVRITMNRTGTTLDPYLYLIGPDGFVMIQDDDSNGGVNSAIGGSGLLTLSQTGKYVIEATSFLGDQTEGYDLGLTVGACTMVVSPSSAQYSAAGGSGSLSVSGNCPSYDFRSYAQDSSWLVHLITGGSGNQSLNYSVAANPNVAGRVGFLIVGGNGNFGGIRVPVYQSGSGPDCIVSPIGFGQTIDGNLTGSSCQSPVRGNGRLAARYSFDAATGQQISIQASGGFDTFLSLIGPDGAVMLNDNDSGGGFNSRIPGGSGFLTLGVTGTYLIEVSAFTAGATGNFSLTLNAGAAASAAQFTSASYNANENSGSIELTINRTGDSSGVASLEYATSGPTYVACHIINGTAAQNCDYAVGAGTVILAPGETTKSILILVNDDLYVEGNETLNVVLSNPAGLSLGSQTSAVATIVDNDTVTPTTNLIDDAQTFVRQAYYDFLTRLPDSGGLAFWTNEITSCGSDTVCVKHRRVAVSNAFFYENEYQRTGSYVFRLYRAAYGNDQPSPNPDASSNVEAKKIPSYGAFVPDRARIVEGADVAQSQLAVANKLANRPEFIARYPLSLNGTQFVDAILATISASGTNLSSQQSALVNIFNQGGRGAVLYRLADDSQTNPIDNRAFIDNEYNRAFVFTEYAGYLRRDSDIGGFLFWLGKVNEFPVRDPFIQQSMVCAFITSAEYQQRFSPVVTRFNADCGD